MDFAVRSIELKELKKIYCRIKRDFAPGEYAPYVVLYHQLRSGTLKGFVLLEGGSEVAYAVCAEGNENGCVLISLMAVYEGIRGRGYGTAFLEELRAVYADKNGIIVEVEKPEAASTAPEKALRERRIAFYQRAGFLLLPNIEYTIWDVPMHLMALPLQASQQAIGDEIVQIINEIYLSLLGKHYIHKMRVIRLESKA
ncbi:MAG: GNAT family N-acetyltransferase [Clostridia bacterium]|nr:GNAT family N-acetyltransferase [Clostridia bacterium]